MKCAACCNTDAGRKPLPVTPSIVSIAVNWHEPLIAAKLDTAFGSGFVAAYAGAFAPAGVAVTRR